MGAQRITVKSSQNIARPPLTPLNWRLGPQDTPHPMRDLVNGLAMPLMTRNQKTDFIKLTYVKKHFLNVDLVIIGPVCYLTRGHVDQSITLYSRQLKQQ